MKQTVFALGWVISLVLTVIATLMFHVIQRQDAQIAELTARMGDLEAEGVVLRQQAAALETPSTAVTPESPESAAGPVMPDGVNVPDLLKNLLANKEPDATGVGAFARMFEGPQGEHMAELSAKMTVNMQYGDLFRDLNLPNEAETQCREILQRHLTRLMKAGLSALKGGQDFDKLGGDYKEVQAEMLQELSQVLSKEELAQFEEYQEGLPQRMLEQSYDMQLRMLGGELTDENRNLVKQILVEELAGLQPNPMAPPDPEALRSLSASHKEAFARALERLSPELASDQYAVAERFIKQQQDMMDAMSGMFGNLKPPTAEEPKPQPSPSQ